MTPKPAARDSSIANSALASHPRPEPGQWLDRYGDKLYNIAWHSLRRHDLAEEVVQDTFVSAFKAVDSFRGESSEGTWLVSILRRKIVDCIRQDWLTKKSVSLEDEYNPEADLFDNQGKWRADALRMGGQAIDMDELWEIINHCMHNLPRRMTQLLTLKMILEKSTDEICKELEISPSTYWVRIHRARLGLAKCVSEKW